MPLVSGELAWPASTPAQRPAPLPPGVLLRFRLDPAGLTLVQRSGATAELDRRLARLRRSLQPAALARALPAARAPAHEEPEAVAREDQQPAQRELSQGARNSLEWQARSRSMQAYAGAAQRLSALDRAPPAVTATTAPMVPLWLDGELILVRRGQGGSRSERGGAAPGSFEGSWLDWPSLAASLLREATALLPGARLVAAGAGDDGQRRLAALPVRLVPGATPAVPARGASVLGILGVAWSGVLLAAGAVLALLLGAHALGERRAAFVSAVSHELRTPLTTFRAYTEMLASGKIEDAERRQSYLETLRREALRLGHLVENVLAWARIEKGARARIEPVAVDELLDRSRERLAERCALAGMQLVVEPAPAGRYALADPVAVEQVLFNLVDNACKYATSATEQRIELRASVAQGAVLLRISDRGPGVPPDARARLFRPFGRSARDAAGSAPGVGLGLALGRRLARAMGGDLVLEDGRPGACFVLRLKSSSSGLPSRARVQ
jgi:signal transduction histidine kinase